jgi:hypothetical protein
MNDREQRQRERAYQIWEDEGRPEGAHEDHWKRAEDRQDLEKQQSDDVTRINQQADDEFAKDDTKARDAATIKPPAAASPD